MCFLGGALNFGGDLLDHSARFFFHMEHHCLGLVVLGKGGAGVNWNGGGDQNYWSFCSSFDSLLFWSFFYFFSSLFPSSGCVPRGMWFREIGGPFGIRWDTPGRSSVLLFVGAS